MLSAAADSAQSKAVSKVARNLIVDIVIICCCGLIVELHMLTADGC